MPGIRHVVFDLGGVIIDLDTERSVRRFEEIGVTDARELLSPYQQKGIFLELENGRITFDGFCEKLSRHVGKALSKEAVAYCWKGFIADTPQYKLDYILGLRKRYGVYLLSNTNPVIMEWARSAGFTPAGRPVTAYFDKIYASYEVGITKPDPRIFEFMFQDAGMIPSESLFIDDGKKNVDVAASLGMKAYQPGNGEDWRGAVDQLL
ncbi:MAG: HAD family phosphatase [Tannerellaceae bacterium]|jgi:putative hydrolase of the HAD superfamily|nr:HAD family phosphatase [Tannerellaceae bacterium]